MRCHHSAAQICTVSPALGYPVISNADSWDTPPPPRLRVRSLLTLHSSASRHCRTHYANVVAVHLCVSETLNPENSLEPDWRETAPQGVNCSKPAIKAQLKSLAESAKVR